MSKIIGIDLGTTNSCVAVVDVMRPQVIPNREGSRTTPSVVGFTEDGERLVGQIAKRQGITNPFNTVFAIKRLMGRKYDSPEIGRAKTTMPYQIVSAANGDVKIKIRDRDYSPEEISAFVLQEIKSFTEEFLEEPLTEAVITVPAYFNDSQRQATRDAGKIAGLEVLRIINEPTAAALAYGLDNRADQIIAVYDLGGGTFDISILKLEDGLFEVLSTSGDTYLGGEDFDRRIMDWLIDGFQRDTGIDLSEDRMALQRLKEAAEKAKHELSISLETKITLPFISADAAGPKHLNRILGRGEFEGMVEDLVQRTIDPVNDALAQAGVNPSQIDEVVLVGGMTRMPRVVEAVKNAFNKEPNRNINPDEVVAIGAALQGGILRGDIKDMILLDVTPLSLGIETHGGLFTKIIERNSTIPTKNSLIFTTVVDNQSKVQVHVLQGERSFAKENKSLGKFDLTGVRPAPRGVPQIEVTFSIDSNGIVNVTALDQATGQSTGVQINPAGGLSSEEIDRIVTDAQEHARLDATRRETRVLQNKLEGMIYTNEKVYREFGKLLPEADRLTVQDAIAQGKEAISSGDRQALSDAMYSLQNAAKLLTSVMLFNPLKSTPGGDDPYMLD
jgi:molecular chaperone DnaK